MTEDISPLFERHGFHETSTGGGCMVYRHDMEGGYHVIVTDWKGCGLPDDMNERCCVGLYSEDGTTQRVWDCEDVRDALHIAEWIRINVMLNEQFVNQVVGDMRGPS